MFLVSNDDDPCTTIMDSPMDRPDSPISESSEPENELIDNAIANSGMVIDEGSTVTQTYTVQSSSSSGVFGAFFGGSYASKRRIPGGMGFGGGLNVREAKARRKDMRGSGGMGLGMWDMGAGVSRVQRDELIDTSLVEQLRARESTFSAIFFLRGARSSKS